MQAISERDRFLQFQYATPSPELGARLPPRIVLEGPRVNDVIIAVKGKKEMNTAKYSGPWLREDNIPYFSGRPTKLSLFIFQ
jgi:hypothetical protein